MGDLEVVEVTLSFNRVIRAGLTEKMKFNREGDRGKTGERKVGKNRLQEEGWRALMWSWPPHLFRLIEFPLFLPGDLPKDPFSASCPLSFTIELMIFIFLLFYEKNGNKHYNLPLLRYVCIFLRKLQLAFL